MRVFPVT